MEATRRHQLRGDEKENEKVMQRETAIMEI
jgi:hypothetical protein